MQSEAQGKNGGATIRRDKLRIPTYETAPAEKAPMFFHLRNNQNTRGNIYPVPMIDRLTQNKTLREYDAVTLENDYLRVVVLPELGGRVYEGYDKVNDYHFVYKNNVIKPALIGLGGAWISGGIEFNWPQHHRPTTFMPVDAVIDEEADGAKTVWLGEVEPMNGTKALLGLSIRPGEAVLRLKARVYNRTPMPQTFHWWANLAVHTGEDYKLVFPPDVDYITTHYKDYCSEFPVVKGEFARTDFGEGTDISWYKNVHAQCSFFIYNSSYDFMAGYDYGKDKGTVHVADHHISPGKKFFTWGTGEFGDVWQKNLTDDDGPYLEIMTGCYTDNQPDFCWLAPFETKIFEQNWYALDRLPHLVNATTRAAVSLTVEDGVAKLAFNATAEHGQAKAVLLLDSVPLLEQAIAIAPGSPWSGEIPVGDADLSRLTAILLDEEGGELVRYAKAPMFFDDKEPPTTHDEARDPAEIQTLEELYLEGLHIEQYRHFHLEPEPWYAEALRRDPDDSRCNVAMGRLALRRGEFATAAEYFRRAVKRITLRNPNPYDGEAYYQLGLALRLSGESGKAVDAYRKAAWNAAWKSPALQEAAMIYLSRGEYAAALAVLEESLAANAQSLRARHLKTAALRFLGRFEEARRLCGETLGFDPLDYGALAELAFLDGDWSPLEAVINNRATAWIALAGDYLSAGLTTETRQLLEHCPEYPLKHYYCGYAWLLDGDNDKALGCFAVGDAASMDYCFPSLDLEYVILEAASKLYTAGARAPYYLGCMYFARGADEAALAAWEESLRRDARLADAHRGFSHALARARGDMAGAYAHMETAFRQNSTSRYLYELVQAAKVAGEPALKRLELLETHLELLEQRDDLYTEYIKLLNICGRYGEAAAKLEGHTFMPYEGGEGLLVQQRITAFLAQGRKALETGDAQSALSLFRDALEYPANLHEGRRYRPREGHVHYHIGLALEVLDQPRQAREAYTAALGEVPEADESQFYRGLALRKLGRDSEAAAAFQWLLDEADRLLARNGRYPYFGGFPMGQPYEEDMARLGEIKARRAQLYGFAGLGDRAAARRAFRRLEQVSDDLTWPRFIFTT